MTHSSFLAEAGRGRSDSVKSDVFEVNRHALNASNRRRDPVGKLARLDHAPHQRLDKRMIVRARDPLVLPGVPGGFRHHLARRADVVSGEIADAPLEAHMWEGKAEGGAELLRNAVPAGQAGLNLFDVVVTQPRVECGER